MGRGRLRSGYWESTVGRRFDLKFLARAILLKRRAIFAFDGVMPATATVCPELTEAAGMAIFTCIYCVNKRGRASRGGQRRRYDLGSIKMR